MTCSAEGPAVVRGLAALAGDQAPQYRAQVRLVGDSRDQGVPERDQPVTRGRPRPQRRRTEGVRLVKLRLDVVQESQQLAIAVTEPTKQRALAHPGHLRDLVHRHMLGTPLGHQPGGRLQEPGTVARGVGPAHP